jgi:hypothetical protein
MLESCKKAILQAAQLKTFDDADRYRTRSWLSCWTYPILAANWRPSLFSDFRFELGVAITMHCPFGKIRFLVMVTLGQANIIAIATNTAGHQSLPPPRNFQIGCAVIRDKIDHLLASEVLQNAQNKTIPKADADY